MRGIAKAFLTVYLIATVTGMGILVFFPGLGKVLGLLILLYAAMPWPLLLRLLKIGVTDTIELFVAAGGIMLNFTILSLLARWPKTRDLQH